MINPGDFTICKYRLDQSLSESLSSNQLVEELWPVIYMLSDKKSKMAYVGETTDANSRMRSHFLHHTKRKLRSIHLISSKQFNKSVALDIEANLIKYLAADGQFELLNANLGIANHRYYQQRKYRELFGQVWEKMRGLGLAKKSLEYIENLNLFKYSPYKTLSPEQTVSLVKILESIAGEGVDKILIQGGAGTGKSILAIFLFKLLQTSAEDLNYREFGEEEKRIVDLVQKIKQRQPEFSMALVVPMSSFRKTLKRVFKGVNGLSSNMVIGPSALSKRKYDLVVVDEAHRLRQRVNLGAGYGSFDKASQTLGLDKLVHTELDWVLKQSSCAVFFYDEDQSIKPSDVPRAHFRKLIKQDNISVLRLNSQFRVLGGNDYVNFIDRLLRGELKLSTDKPFDSTHYDLKLFESLQDMVEAISKKNEEYGLSRLVAGFAWRWNSNPKKKNTDSWKPYDIVEDGVNLRWNSVTEDWINTMGADEEVGCIHTTQGYDLNYTGVLLGREIGRDPVTGNIIALKDEYHDRNGKATIKDPAALLTYIQNIYKTIMLRGIRGTYLYVLDDNLRKYLSQFMTVIPRDKYQQVSIASLEDSSVVPFSSHVPLFSLEAAAGGFSPNQLISGSEEWVKLPRSIKPDKDLFALRVVGESMNKVIPNGAICLFRKYSGGSRKGKIVLMELGDYTDPENHTSLTVKEYTSKITPALGEENQSKIVVLLPRSKDHAFEATEINADEAENLRTIALFEMVISD